MTSTGKPNKGMEALVFDESKSEGAIKSLSASAQPSQSVVSYQLPELDKNQGISYSKIKSKFGPLAASDEERSSKSRKDSRFYLSEATRDGLAIGDEERRALEERVKKEVQTLGDQAREQGFAEGKKAGFEAGHSEALTKYTLEAKEKIGHLNDLIRELDHIMPKLFVVNEKFLLDMVYRIAKMILLKEISTDRDYIKRLAVELIEKVGARENIRLRISENDMKNMEEIRTQIQVELPETQYLTIESSSEVREGGCILETEWNAIHASLEVQLKAIEELIMGSSAEHVIHVDRSDTPPPGEVA